jgi:peptide deformylase
MPVLELRICGDPALRRRAQPVARVDAETRALIRDLFETMDAQQGVGLAAPQVGRPVRVIVVDLSSMGLTGSRRAFVNPSLSEPSGRWTVREGCLSVPGVEADVSRPRRVRLHALDEAGRPVDIAAEGWLARALQHEIDHLDGVLFVDRIGPLRRALLKPKLERLMRRAQRGRA